MFFFDVHGRTRTHGWVKILDPVSGGQLSNSYDRSLGCVPRTAPGGPKTISWCRSPSLWFVPFASLRSPSFSLQLRMDGGPGASGGTTMPPLKLASFWPFRSNVVVLHYETGCPSKVKQ